MANFDKFANLSPAGWSKASVTQTMALGSNAHIGLWGGGPGGVDLVVKAKDPTICVVHEEPLPKGHPHWRHFLITALRDGETTVDACLPGTSNAWATMTVKVTGKSGVRLVFFPGERKVGKTTEGTIYVIGGHGESMIAAGGPPSGHPDRGGHTVDPTPPGHYVLGPRIHVTTASWPMSVIPWDASLRLNAAGEAEFEASPGKWVVATGPNGAVTQAQMAFDRRSGKTPDLRKVTDDTRAIFIDPGTGALRGTLWEANDFGRWGWNLTQNGHNTAYYIHTTPDDEFATAQKKAVLLANSHGCVHLVPSERDRLMSAGYLKQGIPFEVRPYTEVGPP
jgi:hypothetical protein